MGQLEALRVGFESIHVAGPALENRVRERSDMSADIDDDIGRSEGLWQAIFVFVVDLLKNGLVERIGAEEKHKASGT